MAVRAGRMRHRIEVVRDTGSRDEFGGSTNEREVVATPWCSLRVLSEVEDDGRHTGIGQTMIEFTIRYSKSLENPTSDMYVIFKGKEYDITGVVNHLELNEKLIISTRER